MKPHWRHAHISQWLIIGLVAICAVYYALGLPHGFLAHTDEFRTWDRVTGVRAQGDVWTIYSLGEPTFKKPPLQYWMSAGLM